MYVNALFFVLIHKGLNDLDGNFDKTLVYFSQAFMTLYDSESVENSLQAFMGLEDRGELPD